MWRDELSMAFVSATLAAHCRARPALVRNRKTTKLHDVLTQEPFKREDTNAPPCLNHRSSKKFDADGSGTQTMTRSPSGENPGP
jgi:hypothetical protein